MSSSGREKTPLYLDRETHIEPSPLVVMQGPAASYLRFSTKLRRFQSLTGSQSLCCPMDLAENDCEYFVQREHPALDWLFSPGQAREQKTGLCNEGS
jgi:hypothetical protein